MKETFDEALDSIDAYVFSGDALESEEHRRMLKDYCERWLRAIQERSNEGS